MIGERPFRAIYSVLMIAALVWMIGAYNAAPYQRVWDVGLFGPLVILIVMYFAIFFFLCSVTIRDPTLIGMDALHHEVAPGKGIYAIVRHPVLAAFALWAGAHLFVGGDISAILFFGGFWGLATFGMVHIDARRRANADEVGGPSRPAPAEHRSKRSSKTVGHW